MFKKLKNFISDPAKRILYLSQLGFYRHMDDRKYLEKLYRATFGKELNLENPQTFNEKLQWLKLYDRKPIYTTMVDKYAAKEYVADKIGEEYIIPTLGVWDKFDDIDFDALPDEFVLKCTHDSGGLAICKDKKTFNIEAARKKINRCLKRNYYYLFREWPYKDVPPRIIAEEYIEEEGKVVPEDYKVYCFNGKPKYIVVFHNRFDNSKALSESVYDVDWKKQNISLDNHFAISDISQPRPKRLDDLLKFAEILSEGIAQARIDFYIIGNVIKFGEITLYTASGLQPMIPESMDMVLGDFIDLPQKENK